MEELDDARALTVHAPHFVRSECRGHGEHAAAVAFINKTRRVNRREREGGAQAAKAGKRCERYGCCDWRENGMNGAGGVNGGNGVNGVGGVNGGIGVNGAGAVNGGN
eukprot:545889-Pleurochrysis_carterae.AAC.1